MIFRMENRSLTTDKKDKAEGLASFFKEAYNGKVSVDWEYIKSIPKKSILHEISGIITCDGINICIFKLAWYKAPGNNKA